MTQTGIDRDFLAEMNGRFEESIEAFKATSPVWNAAIVADKLHASLAETDPDLLMGYLMTLAPITLRREIGQREMQMRSAARAAAKSTPKREFGKAARNFENARGRQEREQAGHRLFSIFTMDLVIDEHSNRKSACDMTGPDHLFVAAGYRKQAAPSLMQEAFHKAVAAKIGQQRTADFFTEEQYIEMYRSITKQGS